MTSERGFTLIELMIYSMLSIVVLVIVGGLVINSLTAERIVRDATEGTTAGQLVSQSVSHGVRNASAIALTSPTSGTQLLVVRTVGSAATAQWSCRAWHYGAGEVRTTSSATAIAATTDYSGWTLLAAGVSPAPGASVFSLTGRKVGINLDVATGDGRPVRITTTAASRQPVPASGVESLPCF